MVLGGYTSGWILIKYQASYVTKMIVKKPEIKFSGFNYVVFILIVIQLILLSI
jgi:hypothetical protein